MNVRVNRVVIMERAMIKLTVIYVAVYLDILEKTVSLVSCLHCLLLYFFFSYEGIVYCTSIFFYCQLYVAIPQGPL